MGKNFNGVQMNNSPTIVEKAGAAITDCRNRIMKYDGNGDVVLATDGTDIPVGIALIESGYNDIFILFRYRCTGILQTGEDFVCRNDNFPYYLFRISEWSGFTTGCV